MHVVGLTTEYLLPYLAVYERGGGGSDRSASPAFLLQKYNQRASKNIYFDYIHNFTQYKLQNDICRDMFIMNI